MRTILNISLPKGMMSFVRRETKAGKFASVSEFIRFLIRDYEDRKVLRIVEEGRREYERGETKEFKSLKELR